MTVPTIDSARPLAARRCLQLQHADDTDNVERTVFTDGSGIGTGTAAAATSRVTVSYTGWLRARPERTRATCSRSSGSSSESSSVTGRPWTRRNRGTAVTKRSPLARNLRRSERGGQTEDAWPPASREVGGT